MTTTTAILLSITLIQGCDSGEGADVNAENGTAAATGDQIGVEGTTAGEGAGVGETNNETLREECAETSVSGSLRAGDNVVALDGATVSLSTRHSNNCIGEVELAIVSDEGCSLELSAASLSADNWSVLSATTEGCSGIELPSEYVAEESTFGILASPDLESEEACVSASELSLAGSITFAHTEGSFKIRLDEVVFGGDLAAAEADELACAPEVAGCETVSCGEDAFGIVCGSCDEGTKCIDGSCQEWNCPPEGPYGAKIGETVLNIELKDCDGNTHSLQDLCGAPAGFFNLLAGY